MMTRKATPVFFEGTKVVRLSDLPQAQSHLFAGWVKPRDFVALGSTDRDCVQYAEYEYWYQNHFLAEKDLDELL